MNGPCITKSCSADNADECGEAALTIAQLLAYNVHVASSTTTQQLSKPKHQRHSKKRETPAAIYLGIKIHAETRKRTMIDTFHHIWAYAYHMTVFLQYRLILSTVYVPFMRQKA